MKKVLSLALAMLMLVSLCITPVMAAEPKGSKSNALINGDFETGDLTGWDVWQEGYALPEAALNGGYGAHIVGNGSWGGLLSQAASVTAGETYKVSMDVKALSAGVNIQICDGADGSATKLDSGYCDKTEWKHLSWIVVPTGDKLFINICGAGTGTAESVYLDNISVEPLVAEIVNGDFEDADSTAWAYNSGEHEIVSDAHSGNGALKLTNPGQYAEGAIQTIAVKSNTLYNLTWWSKAAVGTGTFNLFLMDGESFNNMTVVDGAAWMNGHTGEWVSHKVVINTGSSTTLAIKISTEGSNPGTILIDDMAIAAAKPSSFDGYLYNGDFETGELSQWVNLWNKCSVSFVEGRDSANALKVEMANQWAMVRQEITVEPNTDYVLTAYVKSDAYFSLLVKDGADAADIASVATAGTSNWMPYQIEFNSGSNSTIYIGLMANEVGASAIIDDVSLAKKEAATLLPLINGDFEAGTAHGWETWQSSSIIGDAAHAGSYGAHIKGDGGWGGLLNQTMNVEVGKSYVLTFWYKVNGGGFNYKLEGSAPEAIASGYLTANEWKQEVVKFTAESDAQINLNFCGSGAGVAEDAYIDDVALMELKDPSFDGYVYNGDFETGIADYWNVYTGTIVSGDAAYEGDYGLLMHSNGGWGGTGDQDITVVAGKKYLVSFWVKTVANGVNFQVKEGETDIASEWISDLADWTLKSFEFTASSDAIKLNFCGGGNDLDTIVYVDNVSVMELKDPSFDGFIYNGDFETGTLTKWDVYQGSIASNAAAKNGTYGANLKGDGGWGAMLEQTFTGLKKGNTYTISFWYKANSGGSNWTLKQNGEIIPVDAENKVNGWIDKGEWTQVSVEFVAPADGEAVLNFCGGGNNIAEDLYVDDILMVETESGSAYAPGDANGDGKVNNRDLGILQQWLNDRDPKGFVKEAADLNGDGKVNNRDLGMLQKELNK